MKKDLQLPSSYDPPISFHYTQGTTLVSSPSINGKTSKAKTTPPNVKRGAPARKGALTGGTEKRSPSGGRGSKARLHSSSSSEDSISSLDDVAALFDGEELGDSPIVRTKREREVQSNVPRKKP